MSTADAWRYAANDGGFRPDDGWSQRARLGFGDIVTLLWRKRFMMAGIFIVITALGLAYALTIKPDYTAYATVVVRLGDENVYHPRAGDAGRGAIATTNAMTDQELDILQSSDLAKRVVDRIGIAAIFPKMKTGHTPAERADATAKAAAAIGKSLGVETAPDLPSIRLSFKHANPDMAARVLNTLIEEYKVYRPSVLLRSNAPAWEAQKNSSQARLDADNAALQRFLDDNNIGDFDAEKTATNANLTNLLSQQSTLRAQLQDAQARLAVTSRNLAAAPAEITSYRDVNVDGAKALDTLIQQRTQLLATMLETSEPVRALDQRIAALRQAQAQAPAAGDSARRIGANPNYQSLQSNRDDAQAAVAAAGASLAEVTREITQANQRLQALNAMEPEFRRLVNDRTVLQDAVTTFSRSVLESNASDAIAQAGPDNILTVSRASPPVQGSSKRKLIAILTIMLAAFTALCAGLLTVFMRPGLPTAVAAGRTLDLPVLATARVKR